MNKQKHFFLIPSFFLVAIIVSILFSSMQVFATYVPASSLSSNVDFIKGQICPSGFTHGGYTEDGKIKCNLLSEGAELTDYASADVASRNWIDVITNDSQSSPGTYFLIGGAPNFCTKKTISTLGEIDIVKINESKVCDSVDGKVCIDGKCLLQDNGGDLMCRNDDVTTGTWKPANNFKQCGGLNNGIIQRCDTGECFGGETCTVEGGTGYIDLIDFKNNTRMGCTNLTCTIEGQKRFHNNIGGADDSCSYGLYTTPLVENSSEISGYAYGEKAGYIKLKGVSQSGVSYGVNMPENSGSGNLSGYVYGEKAGYINFCSPNGLYCATYDSTTKKLSGYIYGEKAGYIKLSGTTASGQNYGVYYDSNTQQLKGEAYGEKSGFIRFYQEEIHPKSGGY